MAEEGGLMDSSYDPREEGKTLRMSKSSFMCYNLCPRQYHWRYMLLKDVREPPTPEMMRGSAVHEQYDDMWIRYRCMDEATRESESIASLLPDDDDVYTAISDIEEQRRTIGGRNSRSTSSASDVL